MAGFLFKLESEDGMPAKPPSVSSAGRRVPVIRSVSATSECGCHAGR